MNYEDEAFDELEKKLQKQVACEITDGSLWRKRQNLEAQRPWIGLTDEEIAQGNKESWVTEQAWQSAVWWAEAKLKEKNG